MSNETRKLATIRKITEIREIPGAEKIELAIVDGWQCVVKKNEFKVGDLCGYLEIDSVVPKENPVWAFMLERKYRVRTVKLMKQISQGVLFELDHVEENYYVPEKYIVEKKDKAKKVSEGDDITSLIGVTKYLTPSERAELEPSFTSQKKKHSWFTKFMTRFQWYRALTKQKSKSYPDWIKKTDEERLQNMPWVLTKKDTHYYAAEKLEGASSTYWYRKLGWGRSEFGVCSRTVRRFELDNSKWSKAARDLNIKEKLKKTGKNIAIQGELIGHGIEGNIYGLSDIDFYIFNVYDIDEKRYYTLSELLSFCVDVGLKHVPILDVWFEQKETVEEMIAYSRNKSEIADVYREGVVIRSYDKSISYKVVDPVYLAGKKGDKE